MRSRHLASLVALLGAACSEPPAPSSAPSNRPAAPSRDRDVLADFDSSAVASSVRASLDAPPTTDGTWKTEELHDLAKPRLVDLVAALTEGRSGPALDKHLATTFLGATTLRPARLETLYDDGTTIVRTSELSRVRPDERGFEPLASAAAPLLAPFGTARRASDHPPHTKAKIFTTRLDPSDPRRFDTRAIVRLDGPRADGRLLQINMEWEIEWRIVERNDETVPLIRSIELAAYDEVETADYLFAEITDGLLGSMPRYREEFLRGCADYHFRTDRLNGNVFAGQIGASVGDVDGDGLEDLYVLQHGGLPNRLFLHRPDGSLVDASDESGLGLLEETECALFVDLDNDGDQDAALAMLNIVVIGTNDGTGRFEFDKRVLSDRDATGHVRSIAAADWDADGDLDLYACYYSNKGPLGTVPVPYHDATNAPGNIAWRNDGAGVWKNVTDEIGLDQNNNKFSYAAVWEDFDLDGDPDLYVVNDFGRNNLYRNDGGHFSDVAVAVGADDIGAGMGITASDVDNDGDIDLYVSNMWSSAGRRIVPQRERFMPSEEDAVWSDYLRHARGNTLLLNDGDGTFTDGTLASAAMNGGWAWGAMAFDLNNDGLDDLYSPNGFLTGETHDDL